VLVNENKYPEKIVSLSEKGPIVDCMFRWPEKKDAILYEWKDVLKKIDPPKIDSKRNQFSVSELDDFFCFLLFYLFLNIVFFSIT